MVLAGARLGLGVTLSKAKPERGLVAFLGWVLHASGRKVSDVVTSMIALSLVIGLLIAVPCGVGKAVLSWAGHTSDSPVVWALPIAGVAAVGLFLMSCLFMNWIAGRFDGWHPAALARLKGLFPDSESGPHSVSGIWAGREALVHADDTTSVQLELGRTQLEPLGLDFMHLGLSELLGTLAGDHTTLDDEGSAAFRHASAMTEDLRELLRLGYTRLEVGEGSEGKVLVASRQPAWLTRVDLREPTVRRTLEVLTRIADRSARVQISLGEDLAWAWTDGGVQTLCPYCRADVEPAGTDPLVACGSCQTVHHEACYVEAGGCTVFACGGRERRPLRA